MAMFGTTQGAPQPAQERPARESSVPVAGSVKPGERSKPSATSTVQPNSLNLK